MERVEGNLPNYDGLRTFDELFHHRDDLLY